MELFILDLVSVDDRFEEVHIALEEVVGFFIWEFSTPDDVEFAEGFECWFNGGLTYPADFAEFFDGWGAGAGGIGTFFEEGEGDISLSGREGDFFEEPVKGFGFTEEQFGFGFSGPSWGTHNLFLVLRELLLGLSLGLIRAIRGIRGWPTSQTRCYGTVVEYNI
jgi:hypothetical protein